ncbi:MAG: serine hydrolase domain-containing protein [Pseudomonadota bacterium]
MLRFKSLVSGLAFSLSFGLISCQAASPSEICQDLSTQLTALHEDGKFDGLAVLAKEDKIICTIAQGNALMFEAVPFTEETRFRIASITKQFTVATILKLWEEGKIDIDANVATYMPQFMGKPAENVTIRQLMEHSSGILPNIEFLRRSDVRENPIELAEDFWDAPLEFEPGSQFDYSNSAYQLLGLLIEEVTGLDYGTALQTYLFTPLGLENTGTVSRGEIVEGLALGYEFKEDGYDVVDPYAEDTGPYAAGMMYSTVGDVVQWNHALYSGEVFKNDSTLGEMTQQRLETEDAPGVFSAYGLFRGNVTDRNIPTIYHDGGFGAFSATNRYFENSDVSMIFFDNASADEDTFSTLEQALIDAAAQL